MRLDRAWIEHHIPHRGRMCLLDEVLEWNAGRISCRTTTHRAADNPLRAHGRLGIACGIEYAAQAMAVHGALLAGLGAAGAAADGTLPPAATAGFLAGIRGVEFHATRFDDLRGDLVCDAVRVAGDHRTALYEFELRCDTVPLLAGRAIVILEGGRRLRL